MIDQQPRIPLMAWLVIALAAALLMTARPVTADDERPEPAEVVPLTQLLSYIRHRFAGQARILKVELEHDVDEGEDFSGWVYEVKLLTQRGDVLKLVYDARDLTLRRFKGRYPKYSDDDDNRTDDD